MTCGVTVMSALCHNSVFEGTETVFFLPFSLSSYNSSYSLINFTCPVFQHQLLPDEILIELWLHLHTFTWEKKPHCHLERAKSCKTHRGRRVKGQRAGFNHKTASKIQSSIFRMLEAKENWGPNRSHAEQSRSSEDTQGPDNRHRNTDDPIRSQGEKKTEFSTQPLVSVTMRKCFRRNKWKCQINLLEPLQH